MGAPCGMMEGQRGTAKIPVERHLEWRGSEGQAAADYSGGERCRRPRVRVHRLAGLITVGSPLCSVSPCRGLIASAAGATPRKRHYGAL